MIIFVEKQGDDVLVYADEGFSEILYDYLYNELQQPAIFEGMVIGSHSFNGTEIHTTLITVHHNEPEYITRRILEKFPGTFKITDGIYRIELGNH